MNRIIKFRGKRVVDKEWVYGYYSYDQFDDLHSISFYVEDGFEEYGVISSTLGQFTGLHDKEGNEIYEGDIVEIRYKTDSIQNIIAEVKWFKLHTHFSALGNNGDHYSISIGGSLVDGVYLIGNVHDNPELLKS